jgi:hypothetical protein
MNINKDEEEEPVKLSRNELLAKARQIKAEKALAKKFSEKVYINKETDVKKPANKSKKVEKKIEVKELIFKEDEIANSPEIVEEVVRVPANRRKKIVKRTIEIEESETDEEVIEEIVKIPKMKKEIKISRDEMKKKMIENNRQRLHNELFS